MFLRSILAMVAAMAASVAFAVSPVAVVWGEKSNAESGAGECRFAQSLAKHAARWLRELGLEADVVSDSELGAALEGRAVAVLVCCNRPGASEMAALRKFAADGGRFVVTYSSSDELANLVGVKLVGYRRCQGIRGFAFGENRPVNIAGHIAQVSSNIYLAEPIAGRSKTIAWWEDRDFQRTEAAAWIEGDRGYWMTHVLLADGDAREKGCLLLSLCATLAPHLWEKAAEARLATSSEVGPWKTTADALADVARLEDGPCRKRASVAVAMAERSRAEAASMLKERRGAEAWRLAGECKERLRAAYGAMRTPADGEIHAIWDHSGMGLYPGDWERTCKELAEAGITDLLVNVAAPGYSHCAMMTFPQSLVYQTYGDQLAGCLAAAHRHGIRVHAWLICLSTNGASKERLDVLGRNGWLVDSTWGGCQDWLDPSSVDLRRHVVAAASELMAKYGIDGLHLDFVRYQDYYNSLGSGIRSRFERDECGGAQVENWNEVSRRQPLFGKIARWRAKQVTALVAEIKAAQLKVAPRLLLSAAVLGRYPACVESVGQDWVQWLECGYFDYVMPMNYTEDGKLYAELLSTQLANRTVARKIVGGIGVTASDSRLASDQVVDQILALRAGGAAGFALFDLDATLSREILPILKLGITAKGKLK